MKAGWQTTSFENCIVKVNYTPKIQRKDFLGDGDYPIVSQEDAYINGYWNKRDDLFKVTTPIIIFGDHTKVLKYIDFDFVLGADGVKILQPQDFLLPKYFYFQLQSANLDSLGYARHYKLLKELDIAYPAKPEQQRIVGILDEAFVGIATAKASAEKNLQNARALFESHLNAVFNQRRGGWVERRLGDVVTRLTNGYVGPTRNIYHESGIPYLLARHVKNNSLLFDGRTFISDAFNRKNKKSTLKAGDVLLVQSGHIGHSAVVTKEHEGHNCHAMIVITPVEGAFIGPYLSLFFSSSGMQQTFQKIRSGSTVPHLTCGEVKEIMVPLPDLATQQCVVDHSREWDSEIQRLTSFYKRKLAALETLKKSLLHDAFRGAL